MIERKKHRDMESMMRKVMTEVLSEHWPKNTKWINRDEAKKMLGIKSDTTLQDLRDIDAIRYSKRGKIILYDKESIQDYLDAGASY